MSRTGRRDPRSQASSGGVQVVVFRVGPHRFAVAREQVMAIRESPRVRSRLNTGALAAVSLPLVSLSLVLGLERDTSVDRRVLEVVHWGERLGIEVTMIEGIRGLSSSVLHPLPAVVGRNLQSANVLGILEWPESQDETGQDDADEDPAALSEGPDPPALALDLSALLVEQGVDIPEVQAG